MAGDTDSGREQQQTKPMNYKPITPPEGRLSALILVLVCALGMTIPHAAFAGMTLKFYGDIIGLGTEITGVPTQNLYDDDQFPDSPAVIENVSAIAGIFSDFIDAGSGLFEWPQPFTTANSGLDNYGGIASGVFIAPSTGDYRFFLRSDDASDLYITAEPLDLDSLKGNDAPAPDAFEGDCCDGFEEGDTATSTFSLEAGEARFITLVWKDGGGGDWMQLGINQNGGPIEVLSLGHVQRFEFSDSAPAEEEIFMAAFAEDLSQFEDEIPAPESQMVSFFVEFDKEMTSAADVPEITWSVGGTVIEGQKGSLLKIKALMANDGDTVKAVIDGVGEKSMTLFIDADTEAPLITGATANGNPAGILVSFNEGVSDSALDKSNYTIDGKTISSITRISESSVLLDIGEYDDSALEITVSGVEDQASSPNRVEDTTIPVAMTPGLVLYLPLDEDSLDLLGKNNGEDSSVSYTSDSERGDVALFEDPDSHINLGIIDEMQGGVPHFSISAWFKRNEDNSGDNTNHNVSNVIVGHSAGATNDNFEIGSAGANIEGYLDTVGRDANLPVIPANIENDKWHHVLFVYDGPAVNEVTVYVDGNLVFENDLYGNILDEGNAINNTQWSIGLARPDNQLWGDFNGRMDDIAFWNIPLNGQMAAALADGSVNPLNVSAVSTGELTINSQPADVEALEASDVTFNADISGSDPAVIVVDWFRDGEMISGEHGLSLTLSGVTPDDSGAKFSYVAYNNNGTFNQLASDEATLTVSVDADAAEIVSAVGIGFGINQVTVVLNEPVTAASAEDTGNYSLSPAVSINSATLQSDEMTVILETGDLDKGTTYELTIDGVTDQSLAGNVTNQKTSFEAIANYELIVQADSPVRYFRFNEEGGATTILDTASGGNDGANVRVGNLASGVELQAPSLIFSDPDNKAARFIAANSAEINVPNGGDLNISNGPWSEKSFEAWIKADSFPPIGATGATAAMGVFEQGGGDRALGTFIWRLPEDTDPNKAHLVFFAFNRLSDGAGSPWFEPADGSEGIYVSQEITIGTTYHVVGVMNGTAEVDGTIELYVDGELADEIEGVGFLYNHSGDIHIGRGDMKLPDNVTGIFAPFDGVIDEVALYNSALTAEQIKRHYDIAFDSDDSGPAKITSGPESTSADERGEVEFSINFAGSQPIDVTWTVNGEVASGNTEGNTSTLVLTTSIDDDGAKIQATVTNGEGEDTSEEATLTVIPETQAPEVTSVKAVGGDINTITITFNEDLDEASALAAGNYTIDGLTINSISINSDKTEVTLQTSEQELGTKYSVNIGDVKDGSSNGNSYSGGAVETTSTFEYSLAVLADNPVGYWRFADSGTVASNEVVDNWNGTYVAVNAATVPEIVEKIVPGSTDTAVKFANNRINIPDNGRMNSGGPYTAKALELWFKADALPRAFDEGVSPEKALLFEQGGQTRGISIYLSGIENNDDPQTADLYFHVWNRGATDGPGAPWGFNIGEPVFVKSEVKIGEVYHAVMSFEGSETENDDFTGFLGNLTGYVNGEEVGVMEGVGLLYAHGDDSSIGMVRQNVVYHDETLATDNSYPFFGVIDELALYNAPLSAERVSFHYQTGLSEVAPPAEDPVFGSVTSDGVNITLEWSSGTLQSAPSIDGPWTDVVGTSPYSEAIANGAKFFRLSN